VSGTLLLPIRVTTNALLVPWRFVLELLLGGAVVEEDGLGRVQRLERGLADPLKRTAGSLLTRMLLLISNVLRAALSMVAG
jgi:hypothetical protein